MNAQEERAITLHLQGCNCAQSVVGAFADKIGVDENAALRIASSFGGGMRVGEMCGAISGMLMVLGLIKGHAVPAGNEKMDYGVLVQTTVEQLRQKYGAIRCVELLAPLGDATAERYDERRKALCNWLICCCVRTCEELIL